MIKASELQALLDAATPYPWTSEPNPGRHNSNGIRSLAHNHNGECSHGDYSDCPTKWEIITTDSGYYGPSHEDADLIVALVNNAQELIDVLWEEDQ